MDLQYLLGRERLSIDLSITSPSASARAVHRAFAAAYGKLLAISVFPARSAAQPLAPWPAVTGSSTSMTAVALPPSVPPPPSVLSADCTTRGDVVLRIRVAKPSDEHAVIALFDAVSDEDRRFRFGGATQTIGHDIIAPMLQGDRSVEITFLASLADDTLVAASTLVDTHEANTAEVALSVHAQWKGKGIAWTLLNHTLTYAAAHGLHEVTSFESGDDRLAINLEREMGFVARLISASPIELSLTKNVAAE